VSGIVNLAYGPVVMIGAITGIGLYAGFGDLGLPPSLAGAPTVALLVGLLGAAHAFGTARWVFRPLAGGTPQAALIAAVGLGLVVEEAMRLSHGARDRWLASLSTARLDVPLPGGAVLAFSDVQLTMMATLVAVTGLLWLLLARSATGRRLRATAQDPTMAGLLGVDPNAMVALAFALGGGLAAIAGLLAAIYYGQADVHMGHLFGFKALTAALLGGIGSIPGALVGGLLIGLIEALWGAYAGLAGKDVAVFAVLVMVLVLRPEGIFGRR
jgi:branched-chain amino acid transport system permease protein